MAPSAWKDGGRGATIHWAVVATSLGQMLVAATAKGVCRLSFAEGRESLAVRFPKAELVEGGAKFEALLVQVLASVEQPGDFASRLHEAEYVVHHQQHFLVQRLAQILRVGQRGHAYPKAHPGRLVHLSEHHERLRHHPGPLHEMLFTNKGLRRRL